MLLANLSFKCQLEMHDPITCEYLKLWKMKCDDDSETSNWIHVNTKVCVCVQCACVCACVQCVCVCVRACVCVICHIVGTVGYSHSL